MDDADLVVYVIAPGEAEPEEKMTNAIYIHSKSDIAPGDGISFSSLTGEGLDRVVDAITSFLSRDSVVISDVPMIESERQERKLGETVEALKDAIKAKNCSVDIIALYFQSALSSLSELTGETTSDDILEVLFSSFCLGK